MAFIPHPSFQFAVVLVGHRLTPFVFRFLAGDLNRQVGKPAVGGSPVPMLDPGRDVYHVARIELLGGLAPLLIIARPAVTSRICPPPDLA